MLKEKLLFVFFTIFCSGITLAGGQKSLESTISDNPDSMNIVASKVIEGDNIDSIPLYKAYYIKGFIAYRKFEFKEMEKFMVKAKELAFTKKDSNLISKIYYYQGIADDRLGNYRDAHEHFKEMHQINLGLQDTFELIYSTLALGNIESSLDLLSESEQHLREGLTYLKTHGNYNLKWNMLRALTNTLKSQYKYSEAYEYAFETLRLNEQEKDSSGIFKSYLSIGVLDLETSKHERAVHYLNMALKFMKETEHPFWKAMIYYNLAATMANIENGSETLKNAKEALKLYREIDAKANISATYNKISKGHLILKDYKKAILYADSALQTETNGVVATNNESYQFLASANYQLKKYNQALQYIQKINLDDPIVSHDQKLYATGLMIEIYRKLGKHEKALANAQKKIEILVKKQDIEEVKKITSIEAKYQSEKEKDKLRHEQLLKDQENLREISRKESIITISLTGIVLTCIILFLLYRLYQNKQRDNHLLEASNVEIKEQAEKLRELDLIKSRFFTNISHEFRTPLTLIKGPVDSLKQKEYIKQEDNNLLTTISQNTNRLLSLINQILELSELRSRKRKLQLSPVNINRFVNRIVSSFESLAEVRQIQLEHESNIQDKFILIEDQSIEKVIINLLSNAFKFTKDKGAIKVNASIKNDFLKIVVTDTGIGIEKDELDKIFEMFYYTESDQSASSGIGLALINELVKNHMGTIKVDSQKGMGTTFTISIPVSENYYQLHEVPYEIKDATPLASPLLVQEQETRQSQKNQEELPHLEKESILLIEDNHEIRSFMKSILQDQFIIYEAENGLLGIEQAVSHTPDLIISDVMMPELNGFDTAKRLKEDERTSHIPIVLLTAKGDKESKLEGLSIKIDDYLIKPFDNDELLVRINNLIQNRKLLQEKFGKNLLNDPEKIDIPSLDQQFINKVRAVIEERLDDADLSVDELAKIVGVSRSQLHRKIVALSGKSTSVFIRNIRLRKAYLLLENQVANISEISDQVGFSSPSYFNKCFKELYGVTPKQVINKE